MGKFRQPYDMVKRGLDITVAACALVVAAPVMAATSIVVFFALGRPILFVQERPGRDGVVFELYKFRSMREANAERGFVTKEQRMTTVGRVLRSTSIDELPSLVNVLKGDMSLVGPRPLLVEYLELYNPVQSRRHEVRPGLTGLAQVSGRNSLAWEERFALDVEYVDSRSLRVDARIVADTIRTVLSRKGINHEGETTMYRFGGSVSQNQASTHGQTIQNP